MGRSRPTVPKQRKNGFDHREHRSKKGRTQDYHKKKQDKVKLKKLKKVQIDRYG